MLFIIVVWSYDKQQYCAKQDHIWHLGTECNRERKPKKGGRGSQKSFVCEVGPTVRLWSQPMSVSFISPYYFPKNTVIVKMTQKCPEINTQLFWGGMAIWYQHKAISTPGYPVKTSWPPTLPNLGRQDLTLSYCMKLHEFLFSLCVCVHQGGWQTLCGYPWQPSSSWQRGERGRRHSEWQDHVNPPLLAVPFRASLK